LCESYDYLRRQELTTRQLDILQTDTLQILWPKISVILRTRVGLMLSLLIHLLEVKRQFKNEMQRFLMSFKMEI
jgi:hypothetical protein